MTYQFSAELWIWPGDSAWYFVTLPKDISTEIKAITAGATRGFGSVRIEAAIASVTWRTSIFPDSKSGCFILPVKKDIRKLTNSSVGDTLQFTLQLLQ